VFAYVGIGVSEGMELEIDKAKELDKTIYYLKSLDASQGNKKSDSI